MSKPRPIRIDGSVAYVPLTRGYEAIIDAADIAIVDRWNWYADVDAHTVYAVRSAKEGGKQSTIIMHRLLVDAPAVMEVDHINGNGLDNRRLNLRLATRSQNMRNKGLSVSNTSGFKGVSWHKSESKWQARITLHRKTRYLGLYPTPEAAHAAYCEASTILHGTFSRAE